MRPSHLFFLTPFYFLIWLGCSEPTNMRDVTAFESFAVNKVVALSGYQEAQSMDVSWQKEKAIIRRTFPTRADAELPSNAFFIRTDKASFDATGRLQLESSKTPIWFIPFGNGADPINLSSGLKCFQYWCNCDGYPSNQQSSQCYKTTDASSGIIRCFTQSGQSCPGGEDRYCVGSAAFVPCESYDLDQYYYDTYFGGLILEAKEVEIIEPAGFKKSNNNTLDLIQVEGEGLYIREEYERHKATSSSDHR